jgi:hypothetical protein
LSFNGTISAASSLPTKIPFPRTETTADRDSVRACVRLLRRKAEQLVLAGPLRWQIGEASNAHAVGEPAIDGRFDQIGRKESQRDCHVDLSRAAVFPFRDAVRACRWISDEFIKPTAAAGISDEFIKPTAAAGNCCHQSRARLGTHRASVFRLDPLRQNDLAAPSCRCLLPRDVKSARILATCFRFCCLGKMDEQLVWLDLNARNVIMDEALVINGLR